MDDTENEYISVYEAARRVGVTPPHIYRLVHEGRLHKYTRPGMPTRYKLRWTEVRELLTYRPEESAEDEGE